MNNKGFAISTIVYGVLIMSSIVLILLISTMSANKDQNDRIYEDIDKQLSELSVENQKADCPVNVRYIVVGSNKSILPDGSVKSAYNHIVELKAVVKGTNVALGKSVIGTELSPAYPFIRITDGDTNTHFYATYNPAINKEVIIDLGQEYQLDYIQLWRYFYDNRTYQETYIKTYDETRINAVYYHHYLSDGLYPETSEGAIFYTPEISC